MTDTWNRAHKLFDSLDPHTAENVEPYVREHAGDLSRAEQDEVIEIVRSLDPAHLRERATSDEIRARLEYLRGELRAERISMGELLELQGLAAHIEPGDVELLEAAGVPEHEPERTYKIIRLYVEEGHPDHRKVIRTGLTLDEARAHCNDPSTRTDEWFDGFEEEQR